MDHPLPVASEDGDLSWSDSYSLESDDGHSVMLPNSPPSWMEQFASEPASMSVGSTMSISCTGQLSPISNGMDVPSGHQESDTCASGSSGFASTPTMNHSASASSTDSWSMDYVASDDMAGANNSESDGDAHWEQGSDDIMAMPKLELLEDDDLCLDEVKEAPLSFLPDGTESAPVKAKRPRGRPRKHPLTPVVTTNKVTKGRSKTGCLTCRKRKKKCDEAKPRCELLRLTFAFPLLTKLRYEL